MDHSRAPLLDTLASGGPDELRSSGRYRARAEELMIGLLK
jgi:hypothetical protein